MDKKTLAEEIKKAIHTVDLVNRPYAVFLNPKDYEKILKVMPDAQERVVLIPDELIEKGKAYQFDRKELEKWGWGLTKGDIK
ncbi:MAG: hypothetical protein J6Y78_02270 [Paludibacteraceae bacterium]|nr:hypothetical protein [Paludibacteraceae bacterium]